MTSQLSPQQFQHIQDHVGFDRWARGEIRQNMAKHEVAPGHVSYPPEVGRRQSHLFEARTWLEDHYSQSVHAKMGGEIDHHQMMREIDVPLHEALPVHHDLVDEYYRSQKNRGQ